MKKPLLDVIFASEKRKKVLLLLRDGSQEMETLLRCLGTNRQALLPQIRILEEHYLVVHYEDTYELTAIGKLAVDEMAPLVGTLEAFDNNIDYWGTHRLDFLPPHLLKKMSELRNCKIINPPITELYSLHKSFNPENIPHSVYIVTTIFYPNFHSIIEEMLESGITVYYIASEELFGKIRTEYPEEFESLMKYETFNIYVYNKKMNFLFFTFDEVHILIQFMRNDSNFANKYVLCNTESSVRWGKELFEHCLKDSTPITEIK
jgi:predicted transcriptional regulator